MPTINQTAHKLLTKATTSSSQFVVISHPVHPKNLSIRAQNTCSAADQELNSINSDIKSFRRLNESKFSPRS
jgi:hypothetical protein